MVKSLKTEFSNILSAHDFSSSLATKLKNLPSKFNKLIEKVKELKNQVHNLEIKLPGDLKEIPTKLEDFTKTVASVQGKLKTLDALPGLLSHVTKALNKFAQVLDSASSKARDQSVPSADQADTMPAEGEKNTNQATISQLFQRRAEKVNMNKPQPKTITPPPIPPEIKEEAKADAARLEGEIRKEELIDLLGLEVVNKEVMEACPKRTRKGWEIIYKQIGIRMDYIHTTKAELSINLDIPLSKQDPLDKLNDLANKKRKHADDIHDYFKANKRLKSSVQYEDHLP
ncbi:hypothetical protein Tco_1288389, partial [Tanacetum coccineum]